MHGRKKNGLVNEHDQIIAWKVRYSISIWFYEFLAWVKHSPLNCTSSLQWIRQKIALYAEVMNKKSRNKITAFFIFYCFKFPNIEFKCAVKDSSFDYHLAASNTSSGFQRSPFSWNFEGIPDQTTSSFCRSICVFFFLIV